jgi:CDGSH-type Zn-finger protein
MDDPKDPLSNGDWTEAPAATNVFQVIRDGPILARGDLVFADEAGTVLRRETTATLCRCGHSGDKPFCDGSHRGAGFVDEVGSATEAKVQPMPDGAATTGPATVILKPTGSLRIVGPLVVIDADGRDYAGGRASICRCGASKAKPWCDNSHRDTGFRAD